MKTLSRSIAWVPMVMLGYLITADAEAQNIDRARFKQMHAQSLTQPVALQDIVWVSLKNGTSKRLQYEYLLTGEGSRYIRGSKPACVQIDRMDAAKASFLLDAFNECGRIGMCGDLGSYARTLGRQETIETMQFIEHGNPSAEQTLKGWRLERSKAESWIAAFQQVILGLQAHEFAHAILHENREPSIEVEAEADGFAMLLAHLAELNISGTAMFLAQSVSSFSFATTHPHASCRIEAAYLGLNKWYEKYNTHSQPRRFNKLPIHADVAKSIRQFLPKKPRLCEKYARGFHRGVREGLKHLTTRTTIRFAFEGFHDRCEVNGGSRR